MSEDVPANRCSDLTVPVSVRDHVKGSLSAPVVLVEYGDYECPDCLNAWPIVKEVRQQIGDKMAFVFRHFPQSSIHPHASVAAQAAESAGAQGKFWPMHDQLFRHQKDLGTIDFTHLALQIGLEVYRFQASMELTSHLRHIGEDQESGTASGVRGTPTFFINGCRHRGPVDTPSLVAAIRQFL